MGESTLLLGERKGKDVCKRQLSIDDAQNETYDDPIKRLHPFGRSHFRLFAVSLFLISIFVLIKIFSVLCHKQYHHDHTIPTFLNLRNNGTWVNAMQNGVYDEMKYATFYLNMDKSVSSKKHELITERNEIIFHESFTLSWDTHQDPHNVIALYCPAEQRDPKRFIDATNLLQLGKSSMDRNGKATNEWVINSFPIIKEDSCEFRLWVRDAQEDESVVFRLGATTKAIAITNGSVLPTNIHLALTANSDEMLVHFSTGSWSNVGNMIPIVIYSKDESSLNDMSSMHTFQTNTGTSTTYSATDLCAEPANIEEPGKFMSPGLLHAVTMTGLLPNEEYFYRVGLTDEASFSNAGGLTFEGVVWSETYSFLSPLPAGSIDVNTGNPLTYIVYADQGISGYGQGDDGKRVSVFTNREIKENGIRAVHHFGDLSYANGAAHVWDSWMDMISIFATSIPLMIGVGNHEYDHTKGGEGKDKSGVRTSYGYMPKWGNFRDDSNGECGVPTSKRFIMPDNGNGVYWYSHKFGLVHTIVISTEHDLSPTSEQYKWLEKDLLSVNRTQTPWLIVEGHRPMYMIEDVPPNTKVGIHIRKNIEKLLRHHKVDLYLAGHYHAYFRSCPGLYQNRCDNGGLTHVTIGTAGAELDSAPLLRRPWSEYFIAEWGYGRISVPNATALLFEFVSDKDGYTKDSIWLQRKAEN